MAVIVIDARIIASSTGRYVERLLGYLQSVDSKNEYLVLLRLSEMDYWQPQAKNFKLVEAPYADFSFGEQFGLKRLIKSLKPDLVHFTMPQYPVFYRGKFISTIHDLTMLHYNHKKWYAFIYSFRRFVFRGVFSRAVKRSARIIVPTNYVKNDLLNNFAVQSKKIVVTHEAADKLKAQPKVYEPLKNDKFLLYVGQATPYKNLDRLVQAFQILVTSNSELVTSKRLKLVIVGKLSDWHKKLQAYVRDENIKGVIFTGFIDNARLAWLYEHAEAYIVPSLSEGFGLPGLEAMQHGAPVIASSNSCLPEVYGDAAVYFDPLNVEDMASVISEVLGDAKLRQKMISAGKSQAQKYSWERMAKQTHDVYKKVLES